MEQYPSAPAPTAAPRGPIVSSSTLTRTPSIARRARVMPPSPIRKLVPLAEAAKARGVKVYHLNIGQPDIPTPEGMLDAYRNHGLTVLAYGHSGGLWEYRENLARHYRQHGIEVDKEHVLVTTGGSEAIIFATLAVTDPGDEVIVPEPFYTNYNGFAVETGARLVPVPCRPEDGYSLPPFEEIRAHVTGRTLAPLEFNEVLNTIHDGILTAGFLFMAMAVLATAVAGRFFCSWGCHILALEDLSAWLLARVGIHPRPVRSRVLLWVPPLAMVHLFVWPQVERLWHGRAQPAPAHAPRPAEELGLTDPTPLPRRRPRAL